MPWNRDIRTRVIGINQTPLFVGVPRRYHSREEHKLQQVVELNSGAMNTNPHTTWSSWSGLGMMETRKRADGYGTRLKKDNDARSRVVREGGHDVSGCMCLFRWGGWARWKRKYQRIL